MRDSLRVAFMGSPEFAVPSLEALRAQANVCLVVTQPDQPAGRGRQLTPTPVKQVALAHGLAVDQPPSVRKPTYAPKLAALDLDLIVVVAYGKILPPAILAAARLGCWNIHASLLPRHRGAAPIQWSILSGDEVTGVTLMQIDEGLDSGPMLLKQTLPIADDDTAGTLHDKLARVGAEVLLTGLAKLREGTLTPTPQDSSLVTLAPLLKKDDGRIAWSEPRKQVALRIRAMDPWPGAFTTLDGEALKLWRPMMVEVACDGIAPGTVVDSHAGLLVVACGDGALAMGELQLPGRRRLPAAALLAGRPIPSGAVLGR